MNLSRLSSFACVRLVHAAVLSVLFVFGFAGRLSAAGSMQVAGLKCEYAVDPLGVDLPQPRLFWRVESDERGQRQTAWQVLASSTREALAADRGDLWDSGQVKDDQTTLVPYAGQTLVSQQQVFWKVRAWDRDGRPTAWSEPANWTMGLLHTDNWSARWIAAPWSSV
jgi:alpha-L-rhamnosidase